MTLLSLAITILLPDLAFAQSRAAGGDNFTLVVSDSGNVWSFGRNASGQLGVGTATDATSPAQIPGLSAVVAVAAGGSHSLALTSTGDVYAWGNNQYGQVGDASNTNRWSPQLLTLPNVVAIAAGYRHSLALTDTGDLYVWGYNAQGQLGRGDTSDSNIPVSVLSGVSAIGAGFYHSLAVKTDGTAWAWGDNVFGQLGNNEINDPTYAPVQMVGISTAVAVYGGLNHSIIRLSDGTLKATGDNSHGQLADGTNASVRIIPVPVVGLTSLQTVAVSWLHNVALDSNGAIWVWGGGGDGVLGTGNQTDVDTPTMLSAPTDISVIGTGRGHSIAIDANGVVSTWGSNTYGELGDGTTVERWLPDPISSSAFSWRVAIPTFSIAAGTYNTTQNVTVAVATADATIHYTVDGTEPTESHPTIASGSSLTVDQSKTLKAKAWKPGMPDSAIRSAAYTLQPLTPTISPSSGTFASQQTVSMQTGTSGAALRFTLDGSDPTASSTLYTGSFAVNATTTIKSVAFKSGWSPSSVQTATLTFNYGTLDAPTIDPATGNYAGTVSVTMSSSQSGATIRYTTNGTIPIASSTAYTAPVPISQNTTVKAKAFHSSYATSAQTSRTYTMSAATPTLSAAAGSYAPGSAVTVSTSEPAASLRMTIDGNDPTSSSPLVASGTSLLLGNFTLKVKAFRSGVGDSAVASAAYTLTSALGPGAVTTGGAHNVLATPDGRIYAWGENGNGQLGNEATTDRPTPTLVNTITGVTAVASGLVHTVALTWDGNVYSWGSNGNGRLGLGDNSPSQSTRPVHVSALSNVVAIAVGDTHSLALTSDGHVYSWGLNANGQLGLGNSGTGTDRNAPTEITTLSNIVSIAAGDSQSFAVTSAGQVYAWGANGNSRLGDGSTNQQNSPLLLAVSNIVAIAAGQAHTLALTSGGRVYGWGANGNGQLGIAPTTTVATPTLVPNFHVSSIVAGDNHSGAIRADGALVMWGNSPSGQVGTGSVTPTVSTPTVVAGPSGVSTLSLGDLHSVAVTSIGEVWAWGESLSYRLGNNNATQDKSSPQSVFTGLSLWAAAAPTINVPSATLTGPTTVTLTSPTAGAVIHYTQNGAVPTETDAEVPANGQIEVSYSSLLRARAFVTGRQPGNAPARADYELQSAPPTISPGTGTYTSAQTVSITPTGAPGTIRYTLDGSEPTAASSLYSAPLGVSTGMTIKAKTFPANGWSASPVATATLVFNYGTLAMPAASPVAGVFGAAQSIALSAAAGTTIRYTLDGSEPSSSSSAYVSALQVNAGSVTIKARAFHSDWSQSAVLSATYTIDTTAPNIVANVWPRPNAEGWNNTPVTITFICSDSTEVVSCPSPVQVATEGGGQVMQRTATDAAGNVSSVSLTLNIDMTPPQVTITAPSTGGSTTATTTAVTGYVADSGSGLAVVRCNELTSPISSGSVSCTVPLTPGRNAVVLHAIDLAGNGNSQGVQVTRGGTASRITLTPNERAVLLGQMFPVSLKDDFGATVTAATWFTTDPLVVSISSDDPPILRAVGVGSATITVSKDGLQAEATISVMAGAHLPDGSIAWTVPPTPGLGTLHPLYANPTNESDPAMFALEHQQWSKTTVRALSSIGEVMWMSEVPGLAQLADFAGGIITKFVDENTGADSVIRAAGPIDSAPWRFESAGQLSGMVQAVDGTIYALETVATDEVTFYGSHVQDRRVVVLNGFTGALLTRIPLAREVHRFVTPPGCTNLGDQDHPETVGPVLDADGNAYLVVRRYVAVTYGCSTGASTVDHGVDLLTLGSTGVLSSAPLLSVHCETMSPTLCPPRAVLRQVIPNPIGGTLATWDLSENGTLKHHLSRIAPDGVVTEQVLDAATYIEVVGDEGIAYADVNGTQKAIDIATWAPLFDFVGFPNKALHNHGVIAHDGETLRMYRGDGTLESSMPLVAHSTSSEIKQREWISVDQDNSIEGRLIRSIAGPASVPTRLSFGQITSRPLGVVQTCSDPALQADVVSPNEPRWKGVPTNHDYRIKFDRTPANALWPSSDSDDSIVNVLFAFEMWEAANTEPASPPLEPTNITFTKVDDGAEDILLAHDDPLPLYNGRPQLALTRATADPQTGLLPHATIAVDPTVTRPVMYKKVTLHEIGHVEGLAHFDDFRPGSVMNPALDAEDFRGWISEVVTVCDRDAARRAAITPWVP